MSLEECQWTYPKHSIVFLAKLMAYGVDDSFLCYLYSYILNGKQCVQINIINSNFLNVILDDHALTAFAKNTENLMCLWEFECNVAIKWFKDIKIISNPENFEAIILDKKKNNHTQEICKGQIFSKTSNFKCPQFWRR